MWLANANVLCRGKSWARFRPDSFFPDLCTDDPDILDYFFSLCDAIGVCYWCKSNSDLCCTFLLFWTSFLSVIIILFWNGFSQVKAAGSCRYQMASECLMSLQHDLPACWRRPRTSKKLPSRRPRRWCHSLPALDLHAKMTQPSELDTWQNHFNAFIMDLKKITGLVRSS